MVDYSSEFNYKIINDPIYGCIGLSQTEVRLLDTRAMQRLRRIRQMGFSSYVFPSGEHSRFVHSLGVLCIIGKMCEHLYRKYGKTSKRRNDVGYVFSLDSIRLLRAAALLHDVGHFPFSHLTENVYGYIENTKSAQLMRRDVEDSSKQDAHLLSNIANHLKQKEKDHEHLGAEVIMRDPEISSILEKAKLKPEDVGCIITGDVQAHPIYAQMLHSSLDADRLDYLLRDSRQAGVSFGKIELEYILRQMRIISTLISGVPTNLIAFDCRAQHAIEHFLMGRYFHYTQVVLHKTSMAFEAIAKALIYKVLSTQQETMPYRDYDNIVSDIGSDRFYEFTDDCFWQLIASASKKMDKNCFVKVLWESLAQRKNPTHVLTITDIVPKASVSPVSKPVNDPSFFLTRYFLENSKDELAKEANIDSKYIGFVESKVSLESIPSHLKTEDCRSDNFLDDVRGAIRIVDKAGKTSFLASDNKSLINKMVDYTSNSIDVFVIGDVPQKNIEKLKKVIKSRALL
jgi:hypothetical protein